MLHLEIFEVQNGQFKYRYKIHTGCKTLKVNHIPLASILYCQFCYAFKMMNILLLRTLDHKEDVFNIINLKIDNQKVVICTVKVLFQLLKRRLLNFWLCAHSIISGILFEGLYIHFIKIIIIQVSSYLF